MQSVQSGGMRISMELFRQVLCCNYVEDHVACVLSTQQQCMRGITVLCCCGLTTQKWYISLGPMAVINCEK